VTIIWVKRSDFKLELMSFDSSNGTMYQLIILSSQEITGTLKARTQC